MPEIKVNMQEVTVDIEVYCGTCGEGLCQQSTGGNTKKRGWPYISVDVCKKCWNEAVKRGYDEGYDEGCRDAKKESENQ